MIDAQTWLVAVAACVVIAAVWAWGIVREDAAVVRAHASGIEAGRALERTAARGAIVADTTTAADGPQSRQDAPGRPESSSFDSLGDRGCAVRPDAMPRPIPDWLANDGSRP